MVAGLLLGVVAACSDDEPAPSSAPEGRPPQTLVYVDRTTLTSYDLDSGETAMVAELPSADVAVSIDGQRYAVVKESSPKGPGPEGFRDPVLLVSEPGGGLVTVGPGRSPVWSPDGEQIAAVVEPDRVSVYDAQGGADQQAAIALGANRWTIAGWTDDHVLGLGANGDVALGEPGESFDEIEQLDLTPNEVWGISPVERTILVVEGSRAYFLRNEAESAEIPLDDTRLGDGTWSPDGDTIVLARLERRSSELVAIDVGSGDVTDVPNSEGAQGNVVWAPDASSFAYVRVDAADRTRLQAVLCTASLECDPLFSWPEGVRLLALF